MSKKTKLNKLTNFFLMLIGAILASIALDVLLMPNQIIDGGIVGISIMISHVTGLSFGNLLIVLNLPFFYIGYRQIGKTFAVSTIFSVIALSVCTHFLRFSPPVTTDLFLASIFGGIVLGIGVGLIIRYGGSLDGTEIVAIILDKRTSFCIGEIIMFFNLFILGAAGFIFSWEKAMYSLVTYFIAFKMIDITIQGLDETKGVTIVTEKPKEISSVILKQLGRGVTVFLGEGGYTGQPKKILYSVVTRLEIAEIKNIVSDIDDTAFVSVTDVHEVIGGRIRNRKNH